MEQLCAYYLFYLPFEQFQFESFHPEETLVTNKGPMQSQDSILKLKEQQKQKLYQEILIKEIVMNKNKFQKKVWNNQEIKALIELKNKGLSWQQISDLIPGTNAPICKRKHERILNQEKRWPKKIDQRVKELFEIENRSWKQINSILKIEFNIFQRKKLRLIRQRYMLHLRSEISKQCWSLEEDLLLLNLIRQYGRKWKEISRKLRGRTQLQIKNRFYGTLLPIQNRASRKLVQHTEK